MLDVGKPFNPEAKALASQLLAGALLEASLVKYRYFHIDISIRKSPLSRRLLSFDRGKRSKRKKKKKKKRRERRREKREKEEKRRRKKKKKKKKRREKREREKKQNLDSISRRCSAREEREREEREREGEKERERERTRASSASLRSSRSTGDKPRHSPLVFFFSVKARRQEQRWTGSLRNWEGASSFTQLPVLFFAFQKNL